VARAGGFDGTVFHRIVPRGIIQGGDPLSKDPAKKARYGTGGLGLLKAEFSSQPMARGAVAAVLRPSSRDSAGNQFFICLSDQPALTGKFTIFGEVVSGMETVDAIGARPVVGDRATERIVIRSVTIGGAAPKPAASAR
jgi:peptidyl-prolyl cis-trans isomerase B (cyclophilin B)